MTKLELLKALNRLENKANAAKCYESQSMLRNFGVYVNSIEPNQAEFLVLEKFVGYLNSIDLKNQDADKAYAGMIRDINGNFAEFHMLNEIVNKELREDQVGNGRAKALEDLYAQILPRLESILSEGKLLENNKLNQLNQLMRAYIEKHLAINAQHIPEYLPPLKRHKKQKRSKGMIGAPTSKTTESLTSARGFFENLTQFFQDLADPNQSPERVIAQFVTALVGLLVSAFTSIFKPFLGPNADQQVSNLADAAVNAFTRLSDQPESPARKQKPSSTFTPSFSAARKDLEAETLRAQTATSSLASPEEDLVSSTRVGPE